MTINDVLPGALECRNVQTPAQNKAYLLNIDARLGDVQAMKEHTLLHRGQRVDIFNLAVCADDPIEFLLIQFRQREV